MINFNNLTTKQLDNLIKKAKIARRNKLQKQSKMSYMDKSLNQIQTEIKHWDKEKKVLDKQYVTLLNDSKRLSKKKEIIHKFLYNVRMKFKFTDTGKEEYITRQFQINSKSNNISEEQKEEARREALKGFDIAEIYNMDFLEFGNEFNNDTVKMETVKLSEIKNGKTSLQYKFLNDVNNIVDSYNNDKKCQLRYIVKSLAGQNLFKHFTMQLLEEQMKKIGIDFTEGVSVKETIKWIKTYYPKVISLYAIDPLYKVFKHYVTSASRYSLVFLVNNRHIYPLYNHQLKKFVSKAKRLDVNQIVKFNYKADDYKYIPSAPVFDEDNDLDDGLNVPVSNINYECVDYQKLVSGDLGDVQVALVEDVYKCCLDICEETGYTITNMRIKQGTITSFVHPKTGQIIESASYYHDRNYFCDKLYSLYNKEAFIFKNQSFPNLCTSWFEEEFGKLILKSCYTDEDAKITDDFHTVPLVNTLIEKFKIDDNCKAFDHKSSYPNAVLSMDVDYAIFSIVDEWKDGPYTGDIKIGEYIIDSYTIDKLGGVFLQKQVLSHNIIKHLITKGWMSQNNIIKYRLASNKADHTILKKFYTKLMEIFPRFDDIEKIEDDKRNKLIHNAFIGSLGTRFSSYDTGFITNDYLTMCAMFNENNEGFNMLK